MFKQWVVVSVARCQTINGFQRNRLLLPGADACLGDHLLDQGSDKVIEIQIGVRVEIIVSVDDPKPSSDWC